MSTTTIKHASTNSSDLYPLPSLCSSISSCNSATTARKRWDDSQFAIELCDDNLLAIDTNKSSSTHNSHSLKQKIINSSNKLFHHTDSIPATTTATTTTATIAKSHRHSANSTNSSNSSTTSQSSKLSTKVSSISRKLKNIISL